MVLFGRQRRAEALNTYWCTKFNTRGKGLRGNLHLIIITVLRVLSL